MNGWQTGNPWLPKASSPSATCSAPGSGQGCHLLSLSPLAPVTPPHTKSCQPCPYPLTFSQHPHLSLSDAVIEVSVSFHSRPVWSFTVITPSLTGEIHYSQVTRIVSSAFCPHPSKLPPWLLCFYWGSGSAIHWRFVWTAMQQVPHLAKHPVLWLLCCCTYSWHYENPYLNSYPLLYSQMDTRFAQHWAHSHRHHRKDSAFPTGSSLAGGVLPPERQQRPSSQHSRGLPLPKVWGLALLPASEAPTLWLWWGQPGSPSPTSPVWPLHKYGEGLPVPALAQPLLLMWQHPVLSPLREVHPMGFPTTCAVPNLSISIRFQPTTGSRGKRHQENPPVLLSYTRAAETLYSSLGLRHAGFTALWRKGQD